MPQTTPAGRDDSAPVFSFPAVQGKKVTAAFDGGRLTSDGGVLVLAQAERMMGICGRLAACIADPRDPSRVVYRLEDILRVRMFAIACGYEDADDLDALRHDPGFRLRWASWTPAKTPRILGHDLIQSPHLPERFDAPTQPVFAGGAPRAAEQGRRSAGGFG